MTPEQKAGQLACIEQTLRTLRDLQRSVCITGIGFEEISNIDEELMRLRRLTRKTSDRIKS